jgi:transcriptional regulator with XRE-family HTH domain
MGSINRHAVKDFRRSKGWSIRELARQSGVDVSILSRIESGERRNPNKDIIDRIADALDVSTRAITNRCDHCEHLIAS